MKKKILFYASEPARFPTEITCINSFSYLNACCFLPFYKEDGLVEYMRNYRPDETIAILTALTEEEIKSLVVNHELFGAMPIILIITDESESMVHEAHKLRPRFLTTVGDDFNYVLDVLKNMVEEGRSTF